MRSQINRRTKKGNRVQVIGFCRFSYPAEGGFQVTHSSLDERIAYLYEPTRIEERFAHFETMCLPGIKDQTDPDFIFAILIGDMMPDMLKERLLDLVATVPQAVVVQRPSGPHRKTCQDAINTLRDMSQPCLQFRHDDDDAISVHFVARLKEAARDCAPLFDKYRLVGFDWHRGFIARPTAEGLWVERTITPYWGVAQAIAVQAGGRQSIMNFSHQKIMNFMPTITFSDEPMFVRGHNNHNDSRQGNHVSPVNLQLLDAKGETEFRTLFAIDADMIRTRFR